MNAEVHAFNAIAGKVVVQDPKDGKTVLLAKEGANVEVLINDVVVIVGGENVVISVAEGVTTVVQVSTHMPDISGPGTVKLNVQKAAAPAAPSRTKTPPKGSTLSYGKE